MKLSITIDLAKIDKTKITNRTFTNKEGQEVTVKELKLDIVPVKEKKTIKETPEYRMVKTHFVSQPTTKEERAEGIKGNILGDGIQFIYPEAPITNPDYGNDDLSPDSIPF